MKLRIAVMILLVLTAGVTSALICGSWQWRGKTADFRARLKTERLPITPTTYEQREIEGLPLPVQRYFRAVLQDGQPIIFYLLMLVAHVAHIFEEVWGRFWLIEAFYGPGWFLLVNWLLFCIPIVLFYFVLQEKRWAYHLSIIYAGIMILNGVGHNIATIVTGRYFDGFAGGYTGIGLLLIGLAMIHHLRKGIPTSQTLRRFAKERFDAALDHVH